MESNIHNQIARSFQNCYFKIKNGVYQRKSTILIDLESILRGCKCIGVSMNHSDFTDILCNSFVAEMPYEWLSTHNLLLRFAPSTCSTVPRLSSLTRYFSFANTSVIWYGPLGPLDPGSTIQTRSPHWKSDSDGH